MDFEQEYQLEQFREVQNQYFDEDNKCYTGVYLSTSIMESMLNLINALSKQSEQHETKVFHIPDVSNQRELLIAFAKWDEETFDDWFSVETKIDEYLLDKSNL